MQEYEEIHQWDELPKTLVHIPSGVQFDLVWSKDGSLVNCFDSHGRMHTRTYQEMQNPKIWSEK